MSARRLGPAQCLANMAALIQRHGAVMIETDPRGFRVMRGVDQDPESHTLWGDEYVAPTIEEAVKACRDESDAELANQVEGTVPA